MKKKLLEYVLPLGLVFVCALGILIFSHRHDITKVSAQPATCETVGNIEYYKCDCGKYFKDKDGKIEIAKDSYIIEALGHDYEAVEWHDNDHLYVKKSVCSKDNTHILMSESVAVTSSNLNSILNPEDLADRNWSSYKLNLSNGNYEQIRVGRANSVSGEGTSVSPYIFNRSIATLEFNGESKDSTIVNGFTFESGHAVKYNGPNGSGGVDYYAYRIYNIGELVFKNMTFTGRAYIQSLLNTTYYNDVTIKIENIVFENVKFDFTSVANVNHAVHIISQNGGIGNVTVKNCEFKNIGGTSANGILIDTRSEDDINISIENCSFQDITFNAVQISGSGSKYQGNIVIRNNTITNTGDRAIRISKLGEDSNAVISGNTLTNASDGDGELLKAAVVDGATVVIADNFWGAKQGTTAVKGMINDGGENILDTNPRAE